MADVNIPTSATGTLPSLLAVCAADTGITRGQVSYFFTDFFDQTYWTESTTTATVTPGGPSGTVKFSTTTGTSGQARWNPANRNYNILPSTTGQKWEVMLRGKWSIPGSTSNATVVAGCVDVGDTVTVDLGYSNVVSTTAFCARVNGTNITGDALDTNWHTFKLWHDGSGTVRFRIDGGTIYTGTPTFTSVNLHPWVFASPIASNSKNNTMTLDWMFIGVDQSP